MVGLPKGAVIIRVDSNALKVAKEFNILDKSLDRTKTGAKQTNSSFTKLDNTSKKLGKTSMRLSTLFKGAISIYALKKGVDATIGSFSKFESGLTDVVNLLSTEEIGRYGDELENLSSGAIELGFAIQDSNKALFDTVSALGANETSFSSYKQAQKLAIGGATQLSIATDGITSIVNAYGKEITEATDVSNAFFTAQKFGKTTVGELASNIGKVAPVAKQAGIGFKELLATSAQLTLGGLSTDEATTSLRQTISALIKPAKEAEEVLRKLGVPVGALELRQKGLAFALKQLSKANEENADALARAIPNIRALTGVSAIGAKEVENIQKIISTINKDIREGTGLNEAYIRKLDDLNQSYKILKGNLTSSAIALGGELAPATKGFIDLLNNQFIGSSDRTSKSLLELKNDLSDLESELLNNEGIKSKIEEFERLTEKTDKTKEETEKLKKITKELADSYPSAISQIDKWGNAVELNTDKLKTANEVELKILENNLKIRNIEFEETIRLGKEQFEEEKALQEKRIGLLSGYQAQLKRIQEGNITLIDFGVNPKNLEDSISRIQTAYSKAQINILEYQNTLKQQQSTQDKLAIINKQFGDTLVEPIKATTEATKELEIAIESISRKNIVSKEMTSSLSQALDELKALEEKIKKDIFSTGEAEKVDIERFKVLTKQVEDSEEAFDSLFVKSDTILLDLEESFKTLGLGITSSFVSSIIDGENALDSLKNVAVDVFSTIASQALNIGLFGGSIGGSTVGGIFGGLFGASQGGIVPEPSNFAGSFANGGLIGKGDDQIASVKTNEMILTDPQQARLFNIADGKAQPTNNSQIVNIYPPKGFEAQRVEKGDNESDIFFRRFNQAQSSERTRGSFRQQQFSISSTGEQAI